MNEGLAPPEGQPDEWGLPAVPERNILRRGWKAIRDSKDAQTTLILIGVAPVAWLVMTGVVFPIALFFASKSTWLLQVMQQRWAISVITVLGLISISMSLIVAVQYIQNRRRYSDVEGNKQFKILQHVLITDVRSEIDIVYTYRYVGRAKFDGADKIYHRYIWSGAGEISIEVVTPGFSLAERHMDPANRHILEFTRDRPVERGATVCLDFKIITKGSSKPQRPAVSKIMDDANWPKLDTHMIARFSEAVDISSVVKETYVSWFADRPFRSDDVTLGGDRMVRWRVARRLGRRYCIRWAYGQAENG